MRSSFSQENGETSILKTVIGIIELGRPFDGVVIGSAVILGMIISKEEALPLDVSIWGFLMGLFLLTGMDSFNDYKDKDMDKLSKPWRPIPRGTVPPRVALLFAIIETVLGLFLAILLDVFIIVIFAVCLAIAYTKYLKPFLLMKNLVVSVGLSMAFVTGINVVSGLFTIKVFYILLLVTLVTFCFEIHKDLGDVKGDSLHGVKSLPVVLGIEKTVVLVIAGYIISWVLVGTFFLLESVEALHVGILALSAITGLYVIYLLIKDTLKYMERTRRLVTVLIGMTVLGLMNLYL
ncbi:MAG: UbiA family prenyltransferase [Candidatus Hodarchaeales archaeon]